MGYQEQGFGGEYGHENFVDFVDTENVEEEMLRKVDEALLEEKLRRTREHFLASIKDIPERTPEEWKLSMYEARRRDVSYQFGRSGEMLNLGKVFMDAYAVDKNVRGLVVGVLSTVLAPVVSAKFASTALYDGARAEILVIDWEKKRTALKAGLVKVKEFLAGEKYDLPKGDDNGLVTV